MSGDISAEQLLNNYLAGFLWADEEWLEREGTSATYWQARLAQTTTVKLLPDGRTKWQIRTKIIENVPDALAASQLCFGLNRYAVGWSFAYDSEDQTVNAIAAISAPPQWDTFFLRLSEKAKLSAWLSDVIAESLAQRLGGVPAFSHPRAQPGLRETYDGTYHYLETLRGRPEWVLDLTPYQFPPIQDIASSIAEMVGASPDAVRCEEAVLRIPVGRFSGRPVGLQAGFDRHPLAGSAWSSSVRLPCAQLSGPLAQQLMTITWTLFDDPETNLLGGWTHDVGQLIFQQWNTMSEARNGEQLGSYNRHSASDLWGFTSTLSDALGTLSQSELPLDGDSGESNDHADRAREVVAAIAEQARRAVSDRPEEGQEPADRRLLWLEHRRTMVVAAWFNPMGPTVTSTELCALPDGAEYLVHYRRHPLAPYYCVVGPVRSSDDLARLESEANKLLIGDESLPNVLLLWEDPDATAVNVPNALRERVIEVAEHSGSDLVGRSAWISRTMGRPWEFAAVDQSEARRAEAASDAATAKPQPDNGFGAWWQLVSSFENVTANFRNLPDAWDGTLNTQRVYGNLRHFDAGPLLVTYSNIGMPGPESDPTAS